MFGLTKEDKINRVNKNIKLPDYVNSFYDAISYYQSEINKVLGGKGLLCNFNTACMEYWMISEPRRVLYGNGIPHDLSQAHGWEVGLYEGLRSFLENNFPQYVDNEDVAQKEFDEIHYGIVDKDDLISDDDISKINNKIKEMKKDPKNWSC